MNIAFFGGSFDPPHFGHDKIVKMALNLLEIDKLIIMPTYISVFKNSFSALPELRLKWVKMLWGGLEKVEISDFEILQNRPVPTIESVNFLYSKLEIKRFYLLIGADHLATLEKWHKFDELKNLVRFVIAKRDHIEIPKFLDKIDIDEKISSSQIRQNPFNEKIPKIIKNEVINFYKRKEI